MTADESKIQRDAHLVESPDGEDFAIVHITEIETSTGAHIHAASMEPLDEKGIAQVERLAEEWQDEIKKGR
jgi:hypothetical protein